MGERSRTAWAIIPAYCEARTVGPVIEATGQAKSISGIIVIDDGSADKTLVNAEAAVVNIDKPAKIVSHNHNKGKAEALMTGVNVAKVMGGEALYAVTFVDADLMHVSSRQTDNSKLTSRLLGTPKYQSGTLQNALSPAIDALTEPVLADKCKMMIGLPHRTPFIDYLRLRLNWGALSGNRSMPV